MQVPRCYKHKQSATLPRLCHTCQRIAVEHEIVAMTVDALLAQGYALQTDIMDDPRPSDSPTKDRATILSEVMSTDDEFLGVFRRADDKEADGWVRFVYGNDGWDVISDYTTPFLKQEDYLSKGARRNET